MPMPQLVSKGMLIRQLVWNLDRHTPTPALKMTAKVEVETAEVYQFTTFQQYEKSYTNRLQLRKLKSNEVLRFLRRQFTFSTDILENLHPFVNVGYSCTA